MDAPILVGVDVGTTKICTLIARVEGEEDFRILGVGIEPSQGMRKGGVVDQQRLAVSIARSVEQAQRSAGMEVESALVSLAGAHVASVNSRGAAGVGGRAITPADVLRAVENASAVAIPHNREVIHVLRRGFILDGQDGIRQPVGMHGYRLEVETVVITASKTALANLRASVEQAGLQVGGFVLNPLASGEEVLTEAEREMGVVVCDIGGGTTDLAIYLEGDVWYTAVLPVGGNHITSDIAHGLRLTPEQAEEVKIRYGHALRSAVGVDEEISIQPFGEPKPVRIPRQDLAYIIEARVEEIFDLALKEIKRSGYDALLSVGMVLTGGSSALPGIRDLASQVLGMPVRLAQPEGLHGLTDRLHSPAYATSVGLLRWAVRMNEFVSLDYRPGRGQGGEWWQKIKEIGRRLLP